jgi:hypothetical protein
MPRPSTATRSLPALAALLAFLLPAVRGGAQEDLTATFKLEGTDAFRGETISIPFSLLGSAMITGFSFSIDFDEEVFECVEVRRVFQKADGTAYWFDVVEFDSSNDAAGNAGVDEGWVLGGIVFDLLPPEPNLGNFPAPGLDTHVLTLDLRVRPDAPLGPTEVSFLDGAQGAGQPVPNIATMKGASFLPETRIAAVGIGALLNIVGDLSLFVRGDATGDLVVDLTDATAVLGHLFLGDPALQCLDAADADDSGELDISDPIAILRSLFLAAGPLPAPSAAPAADPTADDLGCRRGHGTAR